MSVDKKLLRYRFAYADFFSSVFLFSNVFYVFSLHVQQRSPQVAQSQKKASSFDEMADMLHCVAGEIDSNRSNFYRTLNAEKLAFKFKYSQIYLNNFPKGIVK